MSQRKKFHNVGFVFSIVVSIAIIAFVSVQARLQNNSVSQVYAEALNGLGMQPQSTYLTGVTWDTQVAKVTCGDNAAATWSSNDFLYGTLGDCQSSFNIAEVGGHPYAFSKTVTNAKIDGITWSCCGFDGGKIKGSGILAIGSTLYVLGRNWDGRTGVAIAKSTDNGRTFCSNTTCNSSSHDTPDVRIKLGYPTFINFGKGYEGGSNYVYIWGHGCEDSAYSACNKMLMLRVPTASIMDKTKYELFISMQNGVSIWQPMDPGSPNVLSQGGSVFDCSGSGQCDRTGIIYNAPLGRYIAWISDHNGEDDFRNKGKGGFGIYESPTPWDKSSWRKVWHTVCNDCGWDIDGDGSTTGSADDGIGDSGNFTTKWLSTDGKKMYMVYGGTNSLSIRGFTFTVSGPVPTVAPTTIPTHTPTRQSTPTGTSGLSGDANNDGKVDGIDFTIWLSNYGRTNITNNPADFNRDGKVDGIDFTIWLSNYGKVSVTQTPTNRPNSPTTTSQPSPLPTTPNSNIISINSSANLGTVNPLVWGINGPQKETRWNDGSARTNVINRIRDAKIKLVRIGPWQTAKYANGTAVCISPTNCNFALIDQYISAITEAGAEPLFLVNGYPGGIAERDWNNYATFMRTVVRRYPQVKYWQMWNEPPGEPDGVIATFDEYKRFVETVGGAMKQERADIKLGGPTEAHEGNNWTRQAAQQLPLLDTIIWHDYADSGDSQAIMDDVCPSYYDRPVARRSEFGKGVAITEWNMNWGTGGATHHNHYNATRIVSSIISASRARMDYFTLFNLAGNNLLSMTSGSAFTPYPAYYAFYIMGNFTGDTILSANSCGSNRIDHFATRRENIIYVTVVNRNISSSQSVSVQLTGLTNGNYVRRVIDSSTTTTNNPQTTSTPATFSNGVINYTLPPTSVANFVVGN